MNASAQVGSSPCSPRFSPIRLDAQLSRNPSPASIDHASPGRNTRPLRRIASVLAAFVPALVATLLGALILGGPACAVEAVRVTLDAPAIDLTPMIERYRSDGDLIQIDSSRQRR